MVQLSHPYMTTEKITALTIQTFVNKVMSFAFNALTMLVIAFLPRNKCLLISWLQSPSTVILEPKKIKSVAASTFSPSTCHEVMGLYVMILVFLMLSFKPAFSLSSFNLIRVSSVPLHFLPLEQYHLRIWGCWCFSQQSWFQTVIYPAWHFSWCTLHTNEINRVTIYSLVTFLSQFGTSLVLWKFLTVASWPAYRFFGRQARWSGIPISLTIFHSLLWSTQPETLV